MREFGRRVLVVGEPGIVDALGQREVPVTSTDANADAVADRDAGCVVVDASTVDVAPVVDATDAPVFAVVADADEASRALEAGTEDVCVEDGPREAVFVDRVVDAVERAWHEYWHERYRALVEEVGDGMYQLDEDGFIEVVNRRHAELTGYPQSDLVGGHVSRFMDEESIRKGTETIQEILSTAEKRRGRFQFENETGKGDVKVGEVNLAVVSADETGFDGTVGVMRDVTDRVRREEALKRQNERLDEFASVVSHDLRNPLNVIEGNLQLAKAGDEDALAVVEEEVERVNRMLGELLTLAREGRVVDDPEPVSFEAVVRAAWSGVDTGDASLSLVENVGTVQADESRLRELFENLFRNCVEHGGAAVSVEVGARPNGFYVADDGTGIPAADREAVFERGFTTAEDGTGFGLDIVCQIAQAHDWSVTCEASDAGGARFSFDLDAGRARCRASNGRTGAMD